MVSNIGRVMSKLYKLGRDRVLDVIFPFQWDAIRRVIYFTYEPANYWSNFHLGQYLPWWGEGGLQVIFKPIYLTLGPCPTILAEVTIYPEGRERELPSNISTYLFYQSHYLPCYNLPCNSYCFVLACIEAIIHIRTLIFCHDITT